MKLPLTRDIGRPSGERKPLVSDVIKTEIGGDAKKVEHEFYGILDMVASTQGIQIPRDKMPKIEFGDSGMSGYDRWHNKVVLDRGKVGNGETYAAEAGHFIRDYVKGDIGKPWDSDIEHLKVHEFYDRAACTIAKDKAKGTEFEHLFTNTTNYSTPEGRKKLAELGLNARKQYKELKNSPDDYIKQRARGEVEHFKTHSVYALADQYSADELLSVKGLFTLPDEEMKERFFHRKRGGFWSFDWLKGHKKKTESEQMEAGASALSAAIRGAGEIGKSMEKSDE